MVNLRKGFSLARKRNRSGSPLYSVRGGSASVSNDAVQGGRSPRIYGLFLGYEFILYVIKNKIAGYLKIGGRGCAECKTSSGLYA